jgi:hypothetical protein
MTVRVTKAEIEALTTSAGQDLPGWTRNPEASAEFFAAMILRASATPVYDDRGVLTAMRGIGLRRPRD